MEYCVVLFMVYGVRHIFLSVSSFNKSSIKQVSHLLSDMLFVLRSAGNMMSILQAYLERGCQNHKCTA